MGCTVRFYSSSVLMDNQFGERDGCTGNSGSVSLATKSLSARRQGFVDRPIRLLHLRRRLKNLRLKKLNRRAERPNNRFAERVALQQTNKNNMSGPVATGLNLRKLSEAAIGGK